MPGFLGVCLIVLVTGVVFVNGWTDAPNAIASAVSTRALSYGRAVRLAAACNLGGILAMSFLNPSVAATVAEVARLEGATPREAGAALCAAMAAVVLFAVGAWRFGIPTSESHALIAALTGASLALGGRAGFNPAAWGKVLVGLGLSLGAGYLSGLAPYRLLGPGLSRRKGSTLDRLQTLSAGGMAFLHGAQDGQKFLAVFVLADLLAKGQNGAGTIQARDHIPALLLVAAAMSIGTAVGGKRIVETVGGKLVRLEKHQGVCADLGGILCLLAASLGGIPMSTTHTKTTAMMGAAGKGGLDPKVAGGMLLAWAVTFPACGAMGYLLTLLWS